MKTKLIIFYERMAWKLNFQTSQSYSSSFVFVFLMKLKLQCLDFVVSVFIAFDEKFSLDPVQKLFVSIVFCGINITVQMVNMQSLI